MSVAYADQKGVHVTAINVKYDQTAHTRPKSTEINSVETKSVETKSVETKSVENNNSVADSQVIEQVAQDDQVMATPPPEEHKPASDVQDSYPERPSASTASSAEPIELAPSESLWTTKRDGAVKLRVAASGPGSEPPTTVPALLNRALRNFPDSAAMAVKRDGKWVTWSYREYYADIRRAAKSFIKLGLEEFKGVGIIGFNSPEWFISDMGCIFAGGLATGVYTTNSPEACQYVLESSQANVVVVENPSQLKKILQVRDNLPHLKAIVQYSGQVPADTKGVYSWAEFMEVGKDVADDVLDARIKALVPNKCCVLIYTSGTTGNPKGVMLSHDNITWTVETSRKDNEKHLKLTYGKMSIVSYLPLSHIAAQLLDLYITIGYGGTTYFAQPDALKGSLGDTLREVRPDVMMGVPRVWEKMQETLQTAARSITGVRRTIGRWAKGVGLKANYALNRGQRPPFGMSIAEKLLFKKVRGLLGMDNCQVRVSGAAPISKDTLEYFMSINQPLCEVYGMSECSGPHTACYPRANRMNSVGREFTGATTELANQDEDGNGEIVMYGRHVFMGYIDDEEKTKEALDENGGLHSGDIGKKDKDGFLYITGRIKELIITAGGENIPPVAIEDKVKEALPVISKCMLIGDKRKFLSMLITFKVEVDPDTLEPTDTLTLMAQDWVKSVGSSATTVTAILEPGDRTVLQAVQRGIDRVNSRATSNAQKIQKWSLLLKDFSIPGGELGPTMKLKRPVIHQMYAKTIDAFYDESQTPASPLATTPESPSVPASPLVVDAPVDAAAVDAPAVDAAAVDAPAVDAAAVDAPAADASAVDAPAAEPTSAPASLPAVDAPAADAPVADAPAADADAPFPPPPPEASSSSAADGSSQAAESS